MSEMEYITFVPTMTMNKLPDNDITDYRIFIDTYEIGWVVEHSTVTPIGYNKIAFLNLYIPRSKEEYEEIAKKLKEMGFTTIYEIKGCELNAMA
jgi:hypothetical protein